MGTHRDCPCFPGQVIVPPQCLQQLWLSIHRCQALLVGRTRTAVNGAKPLV